MAGLFHRLHRLRPSRPKHPLLRVGFALVGVGLLGLLLVAGLFIGLGMLSVHVARKFSGRPTARPIGRVLDADFHVVQQGNTRRTAVTHSR